MKKLIISLGLALTLSFGTTLDEGVKAANKGDYQTAKTIYEELASKGNVGAQYNLGVMYAKGEGVKQDYFKAKEWYEKAAAQGHAKAQYNIGVFYANGEGVKQDYFKAKEWFGKACDGGEQMGCDNYKKLNQKGY